MGNLQVVHTIFTTSSCPEEVFGAKETDIREKYKYFARIIHPDHNADAIALAEECFKLLNEWKTKAEDKVKYKIYGRNITFKKPVAATPTGREVVIGHYSLSQKIYDGDLSQIFLATDLSTNKGCILKIVNRHNDNDLMANEATNLKRILDFKLKTIVHLPKFVEGFQFKNRQGVIKRVNVFHLNNTRYYNLEEVKKTYPDGIGGEALSWMFNRILGGLFAAHSAGIVHGAIIPSNIIISPETHNGRIVDWCYSVKAGDKLKAIVPKYKSFYPPEVFNKTSLFATDIYMAAKCIAWLSNETLPRPISGFLNYCMLPNPKARPNDVGELFEDFQDTLRKVYGAAKFIPFKM